MNERIDHAAEARMHIEWAHDQQARMGEFDESVQHNATLAVAEATLALVEQQRIANLIALATGVDVISGHGIARMASNEAHRHIVSDPNGEFRPEIRQALGMT